MSSEGGFDGGSDAEPAATERLYLHDDFCFEADATVIAVVEDALAFERTCFYPGGGGQPHDCGWAATIEGERIEIVSVRASAKGVLWHVAKDSPPPDRIGRTMKLSIGRERRMALTRYHTALHVLNTIALRDYGAWITGAQIGTDSSRIDFKFEGFSAALSHELATKVNAVLGEDHQLRSYYISEAEFAGRADLLRTLEVRPPVIGGRVRVVEIEGFDAQACGGTHVHSTADVGEFSVFRTENKGKINKRLYVRLD